LETNKNLDLQLDVESAEQNADL